MTFKQKLKIILNPPPKSQGWDEGKKIKLYGIDKIIRQTFDNASGGPRYDQNRHNSFIRMKLRGSNSYSPQV